MSSTELACIFPQACLHLATFRPKSELPNECVPAEPWLGPSPVAQIEHRTARAPPTSMLSSLSVSRGGRLSLAGTAWEARARQGPF